MTDDGLATEECASAGFPSKPAVVLILSAFILIRWQSTSKKESRHNSN